MGFASDTKSIAWSISVISGKPGSFAGKTLEYVSKSFPTISFTPSSFTSSFISLCTLMVNIFSSFYTHFLNCLVESKGVSGKVHIPINSKIKPPTFMW